MLHTPFLIQAADGDDEIDYTGQEVRQAVGALLRSEGVLDPAALEVTQRAAGATMSVDVAAGHVAITGDSVADQGRYLCWSDAVENVSVPSAASGSRTHRLVAQLQDKQADLGSAYGWELVLLEDTGTGTPDEPDSAVTLALIGPVTSSTGAITDSLITDERPQAGGLPPRAAFFRMTGGTMSIPKGVRRPYVPTFKDPKSWGFTIPDPALGKAVVEVAGWCDFEFSARYNGPSTLDERSNIIIVSRDGAEVERRTEMHGVSRTSTATVCTASWNLLPGDEVQAWCYDAGSNTNLVAANGECSFVGRYRGPA